MRWTDWLLATLIGALSWGAVSFSRHMALIESRAVSQRSSIDVSYTHLPLLIFAGFILVALAYLKLIRPSAGCLALAGVLSLALALLGSALWVWSLVFLMRQGAPLGYDTYRDAFAFWYNGSYLGMALACVGFGAFAVISLVTAALRFRR